MSKLSSICCIFAGIGLACCLTTWAGLRDRHTLREKCEHFHAVQELQGVVLDCGSVTVSAEAWNTATDIVETVWRSHTNRQARAQQTRAANVPSVKGIKRVREIRRARREALKGGGK